MIHRVPLGKCETDSVTQINIPNGGKDLCCMIPLFHSHLRDPKITAIDVNEAHLKVTKNREVIISFLSTLHNLNFMTRLDEKPEEEHIVFLDSDLLAHHIYDLKKAINQFYKKGITGSDIPISYIKLFNTIPDNKPLIEVCRSKLYFGGDNSHLVCFMSYIVRQLIFTIPNGEDFVARMVNSLVLQVLHRLKKDPAYAHNSEYKSKIAQRLISIFNACNEVDQTRQKKLDCIGKVFNQDVFPSILPLSWIFENTRMNPNIKDFTINCLEVKYSIMTLSVLKDQDTRCKIDDNQYNNGILRKTLKECASCQKVMPMMSKCGGCYTTFCSRECQKKMWPEHKEWCGAYKRSLKQKVKALKLPK